MAQLILGLELCYLATEKMIKVFGSSELINFLKLNNVLKNEIFDIEINLFILNNFREIDNLASNEGYAIKKNEIKIYFLEKSIKKTINDKHLPNCIFYPVKPNDFVNLLSRSVLSQLFEQYGLAVTNNIVSGLKDDKKSNLTNTELQLLIQLVIGSKVERKLLEKKVLNFKHEISSNSLDSHLVRLRKKIKLINKKIEITSKESKHVSMFLST